MSEHQPIPNIEKTALPMEQPFKERVYYVTSPEDGTVLVGMDVRLENGYLLWFDTVKERKMKVGSIEAGPQGIAVAIAEEDGTERSYVFAPLTLELYNEKVKQGLISPKEFTDIESLYAALEETRGNAW